MSANSRVGRDVTSWRAWWRQRAWWLTQLVQRADRGGDHSGGDGGVAGGGVDSAVAEQRLDDAEVGAVLQQVGGEAVAQRMDGDALGDPGAGGGIAAGELERGGAEVVVFAPGRKEVIRGVGGAVVAAQDLEQPRREHRVAILGPFALHDAQESALRIDIGNA